LDWYDTLKSLIPYEITRKDADPQIPINNDNSNFFGEPAEVPLSTIIDYLKRDPKFQYIIYTMMAFSVGSGFNNTANTEIPSGRKCLELINDWANDWDLDSINQDIAIDGWASGNSFIHTVPNTEKLEGIYHIALSTITDIKRDNNEVEFYVQQTSSGFRKKVEADQIAHFKLWPINESAFGEGLGQVLARKGVGYKTSNGNTIKRPTYFEMNEMFTDVDAKLFYSGVPRWTVMPDDSAIKFDEKEMQQINSALSKTDPLQHVTFPRKTNIQELGLTTRSNFQPLVARFDKEFSAATKTPLIELISAMDFSYASSEVALSTMLPLLGSYQRKHKRFIEKCFYNPLITQAGKNPKIIKPQINWGAPQKLTVEDIAIVQSILNQSDLINKHSPKDIVDMLIEAGVPLPKTEVLIGQQTNKLKFIRSLEEIGDNPNKLKELIIKEKERINKQRNSLIKTKEKR